MIPLKDNIRTRRRPLVNYVIIGCTTAVFLLSDAGRNELVERLSMIPKRVTSPDSEIIVAAIEQHPVLGPIRTERPAAPTPFPAWLTLLTCIFLHGGWLHFLGNMWFLWIFGDNVEDRLGHGGFLAFYLGTGVIASAAHLLTDPSSEIPTVGASGAIAGVMGAYLVLYPRARVLTLIPIFIFIEIVTLPAFFFLGVWFLLQFLQGTTALASASSGGVAWWAHIGGFVAGCAVIFVLRATHRLGNQPTLILPGSGRGVRYRRYGGRWR